MWQIEQLGTRIFFFFDSNFGMSFLRLFSYEMGAIFLRSGLKKESLSERILKMEKKEEEEERSAEDVDLDFLYASIIHAVVGGSEQ